MLNTLRLRLDRVCAWLRIAILSRYSWLFLPILALGFVAFVASAFTYRGRAALECVLRHGLGLLGPCIFAHCPFAAY